MQPAPDDPTDDLVGPATDPLDPLAKRYLELLRRCLTREAFLDQEWWDVRLDDVPDGREARVRWLFDRWAAVDAYVADFLRASSPPGLGSHPQADAEQ